VKRRHFGSVRRLASGRYQVRYRGPDGLARAGERTFAMKGEADRYLLEVEHALHRGAWADPKQRGQTLASYADEWLSHRAIAVRTRELYADLLRLHIKPQLGSMPLGSISPAEVRRWHKGRSEATGKTRTRQAYGLLRTVLGTAVRDGLLASNPCLITGAGTTRNPERPYVSHEHARSLLDALPPHMTVAGLVTVLVHLRLGELLALRRSDVDLEAGVLHVRRAVTRTKDGPLVKDTKTGQARTVVLPPEALEALRAHMTGTAALPSAPLFFHPNGRPLTREHVRSAWDAARSRTGLADFHWHDLRHAGLTWYAQGGATLREIMQRGGHKTSSAALIYQHAAETREAMLAARLTLKRPTSAPVEDTAS
jgi:integrase